MASAIIDAIEPSGLLGTSTEDVFEALAANSTDTLDEQLTHEDVLAILEQVQELDPIGVGARDLEECLLLQLDQLPSNTPWHEEARAVITEHLDLLGSKDFNSLKRKTKLSESELAEVVALIRTLNPRPGSSIASESADYIIPDVVVRKFEGRWIVELNSEATPQIRINPIYENLLSKSANSEDKNYIRDNLTEAKWF